MLQLHHTSQIIHFAISQAKHQIILINSQYLFQYCLDNIQDLVFFSIKVSFNEIFHDELHVLIFQFGAICSIMHCVMFSSVFLIRHCLCIIFCYSSSAHNFPSCIAPVSLFTYTLCTARARREATGDPSLILPSDSLLVQDQCYISQTSCQI